MRFACVQFDIVWEDKGASHALIERMLDDARPRIDAGAFVLIPELGDTGFSMNLDRIVDDRSLNWAIDLAKRRHIFVQAGFARRHADAIDDRPGRNVAVIISPEGQVVADYEKVHPFSYGRESEHYSGGDHLTLARCGDAIVCPMICYDLRFPELWRLAVINNPPAEVITIGASWPAARQGHWRSLCVARAIENQAYVIACNRCGRDPHLAYAGGSLIVSPKGEIVAEAGEGPAILHGEVDLAALAAWRNEFPALQDVHRELLGRARITAHLPTRPAARDREPA
jgi:predicted amidohydrolase